MLLEDNVDFGVHLHQVLWQRQREQQYNVNNCTATTVPFKQETINFVPTLYSAVLVSKFKSKLTLICIILIAKRVGFWYNGESTRIPPKCPEFDFQISRHMWTESVVLYYVLSSGRFFPGHSGFPFSQKAKIWFDLLWFNFICSLLN